MEDLFSILIAVGAIYGFYRWFNSSTAPASSSSSSSNGGGLSNIRQADVQALRTLFPQIDNSALVYDLMETRSIERTAENVLRRGRLTTPPYGFQLPSHLVVEPLSESLPNNTGNSTSSTKDTHKNLIKKYNLEDKDVDSINVNNGWGTTTGERDRQFKERKAKMILEARRKLIDKKKREVA
ncbi:hypothetical protein J056_000200 [Wallemia ichthyophaga EXF-994]|uniref:CUE domain-containing protein n=1 Tax=Wallemia ichthyophaga (strain EXF-994 / CBS 113033) TaxID=1299270 RepID=R9AXN5_WALI9|nr:uncharacterized protein J056_000200 [Wallemia ichthyophaga EXF-994]EOR04851.1 hypothetical protein J056_000200 [Wallemia ichthyophaga EXF-994]